MRNRSANQGAPRSVRVGHLRRQAFTLVELLVVIGIIALLISILLPALNRARSQAKQVVCLAQMKQIGAAGMMHANDHKGRWPLAGLIFAPSATPDGLNDSRQQLYSYYSDGGKLKCMPIQAALAPYVGMKTMRTDSSANLHEDCSNGIIRKIFSCPADIELIEGQMIQDNAGTYGGSGFLFWNSYGYNEGFLGWAQGGTLGLAPGQNRYRGNISRLKRASEVLVLADGKARDGDRWLAFYDHASYATLNMALTQSGNTAGDASSFDKTRHLGNINCLFADGHGSTSHIDKDSMKDIYLNVGPS